MAKYERIADDIRARIARGELREGERLPAETELTERYRVSLPTLRAALSVLRAEGLIVARHGIGTYVRTPELKARRNATRYQVEKDRARLPLDQRVGQGATEDATGLRYEDLEFNAEFDSEPASEDLARAFDVPIGTTLLCRTYSARSKLEDRPLHFIESYLIYEMAAQNPDLLDAGKETPVPWAGGTQNQLYTIGIELAKITEYITARPPSLAECELLGIGAGISLVCIKKISEDTHGKVVEVSDIILPGDRTEIVTETELEKW